MDFLVSEGIFRGRTIPQGATIGHPVSSLEFSRTLSRMAPRKACGDDGVPAEILKLSPAPFKENFLDLINLVFASEFQLPKETLMGKVIILHKKGDPSLLVNYRPIALLNSTYQLINLILAGRLQDLAERNGVLESSQFGFRRLHRVTDSVQKQQLLLKFAKAGDGKLIRIDLDYANAFNSAGHACLWAILEKFGVPDVDLLKSFYDLASMRVCVGEHETADIFMDTGTAQGSALSPLLFILFINALLRLLDQSELHHGVTGAPKFSHLAFADDLSLYVNSEASANKLLEKIHLFEKWSGLRIALSKSFVTAVMHGKGDVPIVPETTRGSRSSAAGPLRAHLWDLIAVEEDGPDSLLVRVPESTGAKPIRCTSCQKDRSSGCFPLDKQGLVDSAPICLPCRSQWLTSGVSYAGNPLLVIPGSSPTRFLGIHGDMRGDCSKQISIIFQQSAAIIVFLQEKKLSIRHSLSLVSMTLPSYVRFPSGVLSWTIGALRTLDRLWMRAYKMACGVSQSTASCILRLPAELGGRNLPTPLAAVCETLWNHLESCCLGSGGLRELFFLEYQEALNRWHCSDLTELQRAVARHNLTWHRASENRFTFACFLANMLKITLMWQPFPKDSIWCTPSIELARLLIDHQALLSIPGHSLDSRFRCTHVQEEDDTAIFCNSVGNLAKIPLNSRAGCSTAFTLRDMIATNFPAASDTFQLRAVLKGTPVCEVHGTTRTKVHRQGTYIAFTTLDVRGARKSTSPEPSSSMYAEAANAGVTFETTALEVTPGSEASGLDDQHPASPQAPDSTLVNTTQPPLSWFGATMLLRDKRQSLQSQAKKGHLTAGATEELAKLSAGQEAFQRILPKLCAAQYLDLRDVPRTPRGPENLGRFNFYLPSVPGATPADLALASQWLSHRDAKDWASLQLAGLSARGTIHRWLVSGSTFPPADNLTELRRLTRRIAQAQDRNSANHIWSTETALVSRLSASGSIPDQWLQTIRKALEDQDWRLAQGSLESLLEPPKPRPQSRVRQPLQPPSVYGCGADMGIRLISGIHGHRIHCTGLRWERVDAPPSKGRQIYNRALARLLRRGPSSILEDGEWRSLGLEPPYADSFVRPRADEPTHFRPIPEDARETRFLCSINAPTQTRIQALIDMWDHGQHIAFREEIIKGRDLIPLPPSWWPSISCPRRHGWWVQAVDSITLTRCKGCLGMVQITFLNPNTKKCHSCCSTADTSTAGSAARKGRAKRAKTGQDTVPYSALRPLAEVLPGELDQDTVPYSALRPLDEALPGELDHEGWASEEDRDYRGYGWDYDSDWASPGESPPRGDRAVGERGTVHGGKERSRGRKRRHASISPANSHRRNDRFLTLASPEDKDFAPALGRESPSAEGLMVVESSPSPTGLVFGPFSALRSFDDAAPGELAGEGWDSDADWGFRGPDSGDSSPSIRRHASRSPAPPPRRSHRLQTLAESLAALRPPPASQQADLEAGSNGEGSALAPPLRQSNRVQGTRKRLSSDCEASLPDRTHSKAPGLRQSTPRDAASKETKRGAVGAKGYLKHPRRGQRTLRSSAGSTRTSEIGLLFRSVDPSLLEDPTLSGDTSLSLAQVAQCLRRMLELATTGDAQAEDSSTPWHADWFSSADLGFPLVADNFHRDVHPLIRHYVIPRIQAGDKTLESLLKFRGGAGNDHCEVCDQGTGSGPLIICDQCECTYHQHCLGAAAPGMGEDFICPKCRNALEEVIHLRQQEHRPLPPLWERYSIPIRMLDPQVLPAYPTSAPSLNSAQGLRQVLASPPEGGYVAILKDPIVLPEVWHDFRITTMEGISCSEDFRHPFQIEGARWHFLKSLAGDRLGADLVPFISAEANLQGSMDTQNCVYNISWEVLRAAKNLYNATHFLGGTAVTAPPFYEAAGRLNVLFWHSIPTRSTLDLEDSPLVMSLADFTDNDFVEKYVPHLQHCLNWVILTPPLTEDSKKKSFLDRYGNMISTGQGKVFRERGWWRSGQDKLASYATPLEGWVAKGQILDVGLISALTGALQTTVLNEKPFLDDSILAHCYRQGTEMGLLGLHSIQRDIYATDGSLEGGKMGAGVYITRSSRALYCRVGRSCESRTSLRVETCASFLALEHGKDITAPIIILTDSANHLMELEEWVGPGKYPTLHTSKDGDIMRGVLELLQHRVSRGFPTFFLKVRAHRGEPFNEAADRIAPIAFEVEGAPLLWNAKSGRIIYQFAPDPSDLEAALYSASMNDTVKKFIKRQAAVSDFYSSNSTGFVESFMRRPHSSRDLLGACLADSLFPDGAKKRLMQSVGLQFPCRALLHQWGKADSPNCPFCKEKESLGHIQSRCKALEKPRITAHHMIWREILLQLLSLSGDEGVEHKWVVPSAVSTETHKELTIRQLLHHLGFFASDAVLENAVSAFFTKRAERASAYVNQYLRDPDDPSGLLLDISSTADLLDRLRFSSLILEEGTIRRCSTHELHTSVSAFLDLRPDGYAVHKKSKRLAILEFTRAMDSSDDWELQKDAEKRKRYAPVLEFFNSLPDRQGWSLIQFNFTVGVRGSISTEDRTDPLSFVSTLKALGISSQANLEKIRKRVAKRTFEAHDLMLRSYYAVKFSSSTSVDLSRLLGNSFALQHCLRLPI